MKKTILKVTYDPKKNAMSAKEFTRPFSNSAHYDFSLIFGLAGCIAGKIRTMPFEKERMFEILDILHEAMKKVLSESFANTEEEAHE